MNHKEDGYRKDNPQRSACRVSRMSFWYEINILLLLLLFYVYFLLSIMFECDLSS